jgi:hypothetical protein
MLKNRTIPIRSVLLALAIAAVLTGWSLSRSGAQQVPPPATDAAGGATVAMPADTEAAAKAAGTGVAAEEPPTEAERTIDLAIEKIAKLVSVEAKLEQDVEMLNQKFKITGEFKKAPNNRVSMRLDLAGGLPDSSGRFLQVCDGETLWDCEIVLDRPAYRRWAIKGILERLDSPDLDPEVRSKIKTQLGMAGPETLLIGLRRNLRFDIKEEAVLEGRKVWRIHGTWKSRQGLVFDSRQVNPLGVLPPYIPMDAILYLGIDDGWPYYLILEGRAPSVLLETRRIGPDGRPIGSKASMEKVPRSKIVLRYYDVKLNRPIRNDEFVFQAPKEAPVADDTELLVKNLDRQLELSAQKKKSDAVNKDGAILEHPIEIPAPGGAKDDSKPQP